ncbi:MAG: 5-oxoprolinase subunit PxpB [Desulfobacterales bacterium]|nr:5-oxoprolinase subunit PxpB [Desulfobacterales bacterium]
MLYTIPKFRIMGDRGLLVELGDEISRQINQKVRALFIGLAGHNLKGIKELVPGYRSLMVVYDPLVSSLSSFKSQIMDIWGTVDEAQLPSPRIVEIPVVYGDEFGPDLEWVAHYLKMTPEEVIRLHTQPTYQVYMIGFMPGYPYMGEVVDSLVTPRRETPRTHVMQGSVGIAQKQTGIYPVTSPGGWQIIGRTPIRLFDPQKNPPSFLEMGYRVNFYPITAKEM